jgi:hypothetical protein
MPRLLDDPRNRCGEALTRCEDYYFRLCSSLGLPMLDPSPARAVHVRDMRDVEPTQGKALIVTDNIHLVLPLRICLLRERHALTWSSNFWMGLSYLRHNRFAGLIMDLRVQGIEERFVPDFFDEYGRRSHGNRIVLFDNAVSESLRRLLRERDCRLLNRDIAADELAQNLELRHR